MATKKAKQAKPQTDTGPVDGESSEMPEPPDFAALAVEYGNAAIDREKADGEAARGMAYAQLLATIALRDAVLEVGHQFAELNHQMTFGR